MADATKYCSDARSTAFVTIDEAVGMLLGGLDGPVQFRPANGISTAEEEEFLAGLTFSLPEVLNELLDRAESDLAEAEHAGQPNAVLDAKRAVVSDAKAEIARAKVFFCDIEDELSRGESSALRTDRSRSSTAAVHLTISSLDEWARKKYRIAILARDASDDTAQGRQEPPNAAVKSDVDETKNRRPHTRQLDQQQAILAAIKRLGHDPKLLPKNYAGKRGVKFQVRGLLNGTPLFTAKSSFDGAWEDLRGSDDIANAEQPPPPKKSKGDTCGGG